MRTHKTYIREVTETRRYTEVWTSESSSTSYITRDAREPDNRYLVGAPVTTVDKDFREATEVELSLMGARH